MKRDRRCYVVEDILPNFAGKLTSEETNQYVKEHLDECEQCRSLWEAMNVEVSTELPPTRHEIKFLRKLSKARIAAGLLSIMTALLCSYLLYSAEYKFTSDKGVLSLAITEYTSSGNYTPEAYVLETKEIDGVLIAYFKDQSSEDVYGFARLEKGINQKYRLLNARFRPTRNETGIHQNRFDIKDRTYLAVGCHDCAQPIDAYGVIVTEADEFEVAHMKEYEVKNKQFLDIHSEADLQQEVEGQLGIEGPYEFDGFSRPVHLNSAGEDITAQYELPNEDQGNWSSSTSTAETFMLYVFIGIVLLLGGIFARYFLTTK